MNENTVVISERLTKSFRGYHEEAFGEVTDRTKNA